LFSSSLPFYFYRREKVCQLFTLVFQTRFVMAAAAKRNAAGGSASVFATGMTKVCVAKKHTVEPFYSRSTFFMLKN